MVLRIRSVILDRLNLNNHNATNGVGRDPETKKYERVPLLISCTMGTESTIVINQTRILYLILNVKTISVGKPPSFALLPF